MSDSIPANGETQLMEEFYPGNPESRRSSTARRIMALLLALLFLLLLGSSFYLYKILKPSGKVATVEEAGGLHWVRSIYGWGTEPGEQLSSPSSVAVSSDGTIWVPQPFQNILVGFNPDGTYHGQMNGGGTIQGPTSVAIGPDDTFYVVEGARDTVRFLKSDDTEVIPELRVEDPTTVAANDEIVVIGAKAGFAIFKMDGTLVTQVGSFGTGDEQFDSVNGIAIGEDGTIYISDQFNNRISAWDQTGTRKWIKTTGPAGNARGISNMEPLEDESLLQMPLKMTIDGAGRLIVVDPFDFALTVFRPTDSGLDFIAKFGKYGGADGQFNYATAVDYDAGRDVFAVADTLNNRVQILRVDDSGATVASAAKRALSGPLRACLFPFLLLVISLLLIAIVRRRKHRAETADVEMPTAA